MANFWNRRVEYRVIKRTGYVLYKTEALVYVNLMLNPYVDFQLLETATVNEVNA